MTSNDPITVLYVDDEDINLMLFQLTFRKHFTVKTAISGLEALHRLKEDMNIKLIISDMKMPEMDGISFINKVKEINNSIPCAILSGYQKNEELNTYIGSTEKHVNPCYKR